MTAANRISWPLCASASAPHPSFLLAGPVIHTLILDPGFEHQKKKKARHRLREHHSWNEARRTSL
jgi:hypothetical protein